MLRDVDPIIIHFLFIIGGLVALYFGAEWLVGGASSIAIKLGISPLVVGLTVVAFGTSAPELLVSLQANLNGQPDVALGNIIGSNICNIALILGVAAAMKPVVIHLQIIKREMPILIITSLVFVAMLWDKRIERWEGGILFAGIIIYVTASLIEARKEKGAGDYEEFSEEEVEEMKKSGASQMVKSVLLIIVGLVALKFGSQWLVEHGAEVAKWFGVSEAIIALFLFAFGTSLPELATSIVAIRKGQGDIITGNAIGSCIFNILTVIGITAMVHPIAEQNIASLDKMVMLGLTIVITLFMWSRMALNRIEGWLLLFGYLTYSVVRYCMDQGII
ncbi:cation:H+ antiporter [Rubritalea squalenifaciens DSM 18772]|uniref:Cation:H+ antiporter n=1 Tax=Rubritalea squalenifaciens DSM 18772 TaxID=1123071 RepID=A0A1M6IGX7_9BACT|nr:calcium/sodium antiporter [Rubritalea squalenifaciens]SHJ33616.1 cation:H+ antiporter [Rubritalea squalenifaciens DSM 18772]